MADVNFYLFYSSVAVAGLLCRHADRFWIGKPVLGVLLAAGVAGGYLATRLSPFNFADGGWYMQGVIASAACALALAGYTLALLVGAARDRVGARNKS